MRWRFLASATLSLMILFSVQAAAAAPRKPKAYHVDITNFQFLPRQLVVPAGAKVTWTNDDEDPHTVTSPDGQFKGSAALDTRDTFSMVFTKPGTYAYFCTVHPFMTATIMVK